ncbi:ATP-dependent DNA ligase [Streptomyces sp. NBC_01207]|uniref:ATP-dependent DNA ligase n=1 Tax=Streptomyces sp. NBC_01207 TaxID=2903772 RepID=UPI002E142378|nr:hypothetical protein OG457_00245 [Streptomyces sp. NBC_01207]
MQHRRCNTPARCSPDLHGGESVADGLVLDSELVAWDAAAGQLSFEAFHRRAATRSRTATALAAKTPAVFIAFDALQINGIDCWPCPT